MKKKLELIATIVMIAAAVVCIAVNFPAASAAAPVEAANITATVFFLLFWVLFSRLEVAAKISAYIALYTMVAGVVAFFSTIGGWANLFSNLLTAPAIMIFYGIKFFDNMNALCAVMSVFSFVILIYSLITLVNRKPAPVKQSEEEEKEEPPVAESIDISETELVAAAAEYVELINTFENEEIDLPAENAEEITAEEAVAEIPAEETAEMTGEETEVVLPAETTAPIAEADKNPQDNTGTVTKA